jgi:SAM-dependent methyltransferase
VLSAASHWWREQPAETGFWLRLRRLADIGREFVRESMPDRKRQRFGDADYDWDLHVNTTSANVSWRARLIGLFCSSYQPIEADIFRAMMQALSVDFEGFTFVDIGSGKGRAILLAAEYPFQRVIGVELLPELDRIARENIRRVAQAKGAGIPVQSVCGDATEFAFPEEPLVVFLFHPLPETAFRKVIANLGESLDRRPRRAHVVYANPVFEMILAAGGKFVKTGGTHQYALYKFEP